MAAGHILKSESTLSIPPPATAARFRRVSGKRRVGRYSQVCAHEQAVSRLWVKQGCFTCMTCPVVMLKRQQILEAVYEASI